MTETKSQTLSGVSETLLNTPYLRAMESQRPDALIEDEKAATPATQLTTTYPHRQTAPEYRIHPN